MTGEPERVRYPAPYRFASSLGVVVALLGSCLYYLLRDPTPRRAVTVVAYLDTVGPFWPVVFGVGAVALVSALAVGRGRSLALLVAAGVLAMYATAVAYTAPRTGTGWPTAALAAGLAVHAVALSASYPDG